MYDIKCISVKEDIWELTLTNSPIFCGSYAQCYAKMVNLKNRGKY